MTSLCFSLCMLLPFISLTRQSFFKKITATAYHSHNVILNSFDLVSKIEKNSNTFFFFGICKPSMSVHLCLLYVLVTEDLVIIIEIIQRHHKWVQIQQAGLLFFFIVKQELGPEMMEESLAGVRGIYGENGAL